MNTWIGMLVRPDRAEVNRVLDAFIQHPLRLEQGTLDAIVCGLDAWGQAMGAELGQDMGLPFLKMWWRTSQLKSVLRQEFGNSEVLGPLDYRETIEERPWAPVGTVFHWSAANVPIQPFLSLTSGLLSGNRNIVRVPSALANFVEAVLAVAPSSALPVLERVLFVAFPHEEHDLASACARRADAAMIWGGQDAVTTVRNLPFPHWARLHVFGPRISTAMVLLDKYTLDHDVELRRLCRRIARETWQFDQQACSSPLALYLQVAPDAATAAGGREAVERVFIEALALAFEEEEQAHPRPELEARTSVDVALARANWLLNEENAKAIFPTTPAWSILYGGALGRIPELTHGKTLHIVSSDNLETAATRFNCSVQTVGTWVREPSLELGIARQALVRGVDRVVRLGLMHVFNSPWDGYELVRPLCRKTHFISIRPTERSINARG